MKVLWAVATVMPNSAIWCWIFEGYFDFFKSKYFNYYVSGSVIGIVVGHLFSRGLLK